MYIEFDAARNDPRRSSDADARERNVQVLPRYLISTRACLPKHPLLYSKVAQRRNWDGNGKEKTDRDCATVTVRMYYHYKEQDERARVESSLA